MLNSGEDQMPLRRAAQYLRMSTDHQRYSIENQKAAIAQYAGAHGFEIVHTYADPGKSGLTLKGRAALQLLLSDALKADCDFEAILVLDVSRWGRFQDPDQAAHYEFICRQAGRRVIYCAEQFSDDMSISANIMKHLKRVMAAEYVRELSVKLSRAHIQQAHLGFHQGASVPYGFRRLLVDCQGNPRFILQPGQVKAIATDRVIVVAGPPEEQEVIRRIFRWCARGRLSTAAIAGKLRADGVPADEGRKWSSSKIYRLLKSELCVGIYTYNKFPSPLKSEIIANPEHLWVRVNLFKPIVTVSLFRQAQIQLRKNWHHSRYTNSELIRKLKSLLKSKGYLSHSLISNSKSIPSVGMIRSRFGSIRDAAHLAGYDPPDWLLRNHDGRIWTNDDLLDGLRRLHTRDGYFSCRAIKMDPDLPSLGTFTRRFGSMKKALELTGCRLHSAQEVHIAAHARFRERRGDRPRASTTEAMLARLRRLLDQHGYLSSALIADDPEMPTPSTIVNRFGSLRKAYAAVGWVVTRSQIVVATNKRLVPCPGNESIEAMLSGLRRLLYRHGYLSAELIDADPGMPSHFTVALRFGSLIRAYAAAGWPMDKHQIYKERSKRLARLPRKVRGGRT